MKDAMAARTPEVNVPVKFMKGMMTNALEEAGPNICEAELKLVEAHACIAELQDLGYRKVVLFDKAMNLLCALADRFGHQSVDQFIQSMQLSDPLTTQAEDAAKATRVNEDGRKFEDWLDEMLQKVTRGKGAPQPFQQDISVQTESSVQDAQMQTVEDDATSSAGKDGWSLLAPRSKSGKSAGLSKFEAGPENEDDNDAVAAQQWPSQSSSVQPKMRKTILASMFSSPLSMIKRVGRSSVRVSRSSDIRSSAVRPAEEEGKEEEEEDVGPQAAKQEAQKPPSALKGTRIESERQRVSVASGNSSERPTSQSSPRSFGSAKRESGIVPDPDASRRNSLNSVKGSGLKKGPKEDEVPLADLLKRQQRLRRSSLSAGQATAPVPTT